MSQRYHITLAQLTTWNPALGFPDGHNCTTKFWVGYDYCVGVAGWNTSPVSSSIVPSSTVSGLSYPTQDGITPSCNNYVEAKKGDYCYKFAQDNNITTDELYSWNSILGANGADCSTQFQAGYDYCVSINASRLQASSAKTNLCDFPAGRCIHIRRLKLWAFRYCIRHSAHSERSRKQLQQGRRGAEGRDVFLFCSE